MFEKLEPRSEDAIMALMTACKADPNPKKIDLGVGVYKTPDGRTPVMTAVKASEARIMEREDTKTYVSTIGNIAFRERLLDLVLGEGHPAIKEGRVATAQAAGGSGALSLLGSLLAEAAPKATVWAGTPTWANHRPLITVSGLSMDQYPYYDRETLSVDFKAMCEHLKTHAKAGDIVLLHGCCHNPTGADLSPDQWDQLIDLLNEKSLLPFIDLAYMGLGQGFEADGYGVRKIASNCPESVMAISCSKNFGLYRERVGLVAVVTGSPEIKTITEGQLGALQRRSISMPPNHGAEIVATILGDPTLRQDWEAELGEMRERMIRLRQTLSEALNVQGAEVMASAVAAQNGMFSTLPLSKTQAETLRAQHSVYLTNSGRINVAGLTSENIPRLTDAILSVL